MKKRISLIILIGMLAALPCPSAAPAGKVPGRKAPTTQLVSFNLGLRIDTESISFDGLFTVDDSSARDKDGDSNARALTDGPKNKKTKSHIALHRWTRRILVGQSFTILTRIHKGYVAARALHRTASRVTINWLKNKFRERRELKGFLNADRCRSS